MTYSGHVEKGVVVFDGPAQIEDGTFVSIEIIENKAVGQKPNFKSLRGTPVVYHDPFGPAVPESDWDVLK